MDIIFRKRIFILENCILDSITIRNSIFIFTKNNITYQKLANIRNHGWLMWQVFHIDTHWHSKLQSPRRFHITLGLVVASQHWLRVRQRIIYKVTSIPYKGRFTKSPPFLQNILQDYILGRAVRSAFRNLICEHRSELAQVRELLVWLPLKSGTTYLTLYDLATLLHYLKRI